MFGSNRATLTLQATFTSDVNGTVRLVGFLQQVSQEKVGGTGNGLYIYHTWVQLWASEAEIRPKGASDFALR